MSTHNLSVNRPYDVLNAVEADLKDQPDLLARLRRDKNTPKMLLFTQIAIAKATEREDYPLLLAVDIREKLKTALRDQVPWFDLSMSNLGGPANASLTVRFSLDPEKSWSNGIFQNSRHGLFSFDGREKAIEHFSGHGLPEKWRKTRFKSADDAVQKFMAYIDRISAPASLPAQDGYVAKGWPVASTPAEKEARSALIASVNRPEDLNPTRLDDALERMEPNASIKAMRGYLATLQMQGKIGLALSTRLLRHLED